MRVFVPKYIRIRVCMCMGIRNICVHVCHVQMMNSWICQGDENVCMWVYTHMCMCIRSCMCKSRHANHLHSHLHIILYSTQTIAD